MLKTHFLTFLSYLIRSPSHLIISMTYETWDYVMHFDVHSELLKNIFEEKSLDGYIKRRETCLDKKCPYFNIYWRMRILNTNNMPINWVNGTIDMFGRGNNMCQLTWITCFTFEWDSLHYICSKWHIMSFDVLSAKCVDIMECNTQMTLKIRKYYPT